MSDSTSAAWDFQAAAARDLDETRRDPRRSWVPPTLATLVAAVRATTLARLYPFTSHSRLCLSDGPSFWSGEGAVAPAFVSLDRDSGYTIWDGGPYLETAAPVLTTGDPKTAAAELERLLQQWPEHTSGTPRP